MKMIKKTVLTLLLISVFTILYGCGKNATEDKNTGGESWAYNFDKTTDILNLNTDGTASYILKVYENGNQIKKKQDYTSYTKDDSYITLKEKNGNELKLRYVKTDEGIDLYEKTEYEAIVRKSENGLAGVWTDVNNSDYFYEFTEDGTFNEDGCFSGKYIVNEAEGTIRFVYDGDFPEALLYYTTEGNSLFVEYPWPMVITEKK